MTIPQIYDVALDQFRDVTQRDVDMLMKLNRAYGKIVTAVRDAKIEYYTSLDMPVPVEPRMMGVRYAEEPAYIKRTDEEANP